MSLLFIYAPNIYSIASHTKIMDSIDYKATTHTYKNTYTNMKKRTYCEKHVTAFVFIHQMLTAAYCYQKKN